MEPIWNWVNYFNFYSSSCSGITISNAIIIIFHRQGHCSLSYIIFYTPILVWFCHLKVSHDQRFCGKKIRIDSLDPQLHCFLLTSKKVKPSIVGSKLLPLNCLWSENINKRIYGPAIRHGLQFHSNMVAFSKLYSY